MNTWNYLTNPAYAGMFWPEVIVGLAVAVMCSLLSVLVVLKRLSFIGQGISHAAFGGVGIAAILGFTGAGIAGTATGGLAYLAIVTLFCLGAAAIIARLSDRRTTSADTAIGIVLVSSMMLGAILLHESFARAGATGRAPPPSWESILFGSIGGVAWPDAASAWAIATLVIAALWWSRRPLLFWAFDEPAAPAFGIPSRSMRFLLMLLLTLAIVASMKLAGVVLATALLVLPGAAALHLSDRLARVLILSTTIATFGVAGGLILSFEANWPGGPSIVAVLTVLYLAARLATAPTRTPAPA